VRIRLDLRPQRRTEKPGGGPFFLRVGVLSLSLIGVLLFLVDGGYALLLLRGTREDRGAVLSEVARMEKQEREIREELLELSARVASRDEDARFALSDLPHLEFLSALEAILPPRVVLERVDLRPGTASLSGYAPEEESVIRFARELKRSSAVTDVPMPTLSREGTGASSVRFSLTVGLRGLEQMTGSSLLGEANP
jgi:Tfp pilus assembly protein PilN